MKKYVTNERKRKVVKKNTTNVIVYSIVKCCNYRMC
jgi:hypothetical protein